MKIPPLRYLATLVGGIVMLGCADGQAPTESSWLLCAIVTGRSSRWSRCANVRSAVRRPRLVRTLSSRGSSAPAPRDLPRLAA
jgi:hypothetical protein